jgi:alpha-L-fucosidase
MAPAGIIPPQDCHYTWNPETDRLYLHIFSYPDRRVRLCGINAEDVEYAQLLNDGSEIQFTETLPVDETLDAPARVNNAKAPAPGNIRLALPVESPENCPVPVIELFLK